MLRVRCLIHPTSAVCATADTAQGEKRLFSGQNQATLTSDGRPLGECRISAVSVKTTALLGTVFYAPLEARGSNAVLQPFLSAGLGLAQNKVGDWTRVNPGATQPSRTFAGDTSSSLAWSVGAGLSYQVTKPGKWPVILEASVRYYDFGSASGGATPLAGSGASQPVQPLTFDHSQSVVSIGVRIPLRRY